MKKVVVASHVSLIDGKQYDGIGNVLKVSLDTLVEEYRFLRNSIDGKLPSKVHTYRSGKIVESNSLNVRKSPSFVRYISEVSNTIRYFRKDNENIDVYIGVDPLNALSGIILRNLGKVSTAIYYTADYTQRRFESKLLNAAYHKIDKYCVRNADEVWSVSSRIVEVRRHMGLTSEKNILVPNVPPVEYKEYSKNKHNKLELITTGIVDVQLDYQGVFEAIAKLKGEFPGILFTIIGNGPEEVRLKEIVSDLGITEHVRFLGRQPLDVTLGYVSRAGIGLALYTGEWAFNEYGDSTKCREFFSYGLPVISTDTHSTVEDIRVAEAGIIVPKNVDAYVDAIKALIENYEVYSKRSACLGKEYEGIHRRELSRILDI